jgi:hypothetical protein
LLRIHEEGGAEVDENRRAAAAAGAVSAWTEAGVVIGRIEEAALHAASQLVDEARRGAM